MKSGFFNIYEHIKMGNIYEHIKMCTYTDTHREKGCSFIELAVNLAADRKSVV